MRRYIVRLTRARRAWPPSPTPSDDDPDPRARARLVTNLALFALCATGVCVWIITFTDSLPIIAAFLGLGGAFAWFSFASNLLTDGTRKHIQASFEERVLQHPILPVVLLMLSAIFLYYAGGRGSLKLDGTAAAANVLVSVHAGKKTMTTKEACGPYRPAVLERALVHPGQTVKVLVPTSWLSSAWVHVRADGVGVTTRQVRGFGIHQLIVPHDFQEAPALLGYVVGERLIRDVLAVGKTFRMIVSVGKDVCSTIDNYRGEFIWVGVSDVPVGDQIKADVRAEYLQAQVPPERTGVLDVQRSVHPWLAPPPGTKVTFQLQRVLEDQAPVTAATTIAEMPTAAPARTRPTLIRIGATQRGTP